MVLPRIPYTHPLPAPPFLTTTSLPASITALTAFLTTHSRPLLLTGAGISVQSGLRDYRGPSGTYRQKPTHRPIFFTEFTTQHISRQRYWARSFIGWPSMARATPNRAHHAIRALWDLGVLSGGLITQNVDSLHLRASPHIPSIELHGTLRSCTCLTCGGTTPRARVQDDLARLNHRWAELLLDTSVDISTNPDGDVDLPGASYSAFRYPVCPHCVPTEGGAVAYEEGVGVLKPDVTFFGESVRPAARDAAERWVAEADALLVVGSSLATYSAWRLVRDAHVAGKAIAVLNLGGVRGEDVFFASRDQTGERVRLEFAASDVLAGVVRELGGTVALEDEGGS